MIATEQMTAWLLKQAQIRQLADALNRIDRTPATVGNGNTVLTRDYGMWVNGELESHPMLGPGRAAREARTRQNGGQG